MAISTKRVEWLMFDSSKTFPGSSPRRATSSICDDQVVFLAAKLQKPLLLEGPAARARLELTPGTRIQAKLETQI